MPVNDYSRIPLSWRPDRSRLTPPVYISLASLLESDIRSGALLPGTRLPPQRELADFLDIHFTTVTRAYDLCRERNLIYGVTGRGTFVASPGTVDNPAKQDEEIVELGVVVGFPELVSQVVDAARLVLMQPDIGSLFGYDNRNGLARHREIGVQWMRSSGVNVGIDQTAVFAGSQNAITVALLSLFQLGDVIATDCFTYANMLSAARLAHLRIEPIIGDDEGMIPDALDEACRQKRVRGLFLMPNCANPTTITMTEKRRDDIARVCEKYGLIVLEDDAAILPVAGRRPLFDRIPKQTLYISAATRHLAPGLRVAFAAFPEQFSTPIVQGLYHTSIKASALDAEIITQIILSGNAQTLLQSKYRMALEANRIFDRTFGLSPTKKASFFRCLMLKPSNESGRDIENRLLKKGLRVCHSYRFSVDKNPQQQFLRISVSSAPNLRILDMALSRLRSLAVCASLI